MSQIKITDYWAVWCQPCKIMDPILDELEQEYKGKEVVFEKVNVDDHQELASRLGVMSIPTFIVEKDGQEVGRKIGVTSKAELKKLLDS